MTYLKLLNFSWKRQTRRKHCHVVTSAVFRKHDTKSLYCRYVTSKHWQNLFVWILDHFEFNFLKAGCVVPENIHTFQTEGIFSKPTTPLDIRIKSRAFVCKTSSNGTVSTDQALSKSNGKETVCLWCHMIKRGFPNSHPSTSKIQLTIFYGF